MSAITETQEMEYKPRAAIDFDGVIYTMKSGWDEGRLEDPPVPGVQEGMQKLRDAGFHLIIFSVRCHSREFRNGENYLQQSGQMIAYMMRHKIPFDEVYDGPGKVIAEIYVDDRGYRFEGDWNKTVEDVTRLIKKERGGQTTMYTGPDYE